MNFRHLLLAALLPAAAHAGPRTSATYAVLTDTADAGGRRTASAAYTNDASTGGAGGPATAPAAAARAGYAGQLFDVTALVLTAAALNVNEGATVQLGAWPALDDATFLAVPAASVAWSATGPLSIAASGAATAGVVFQNTSATAQGGFGGFTGTLALTVLNVNPDDFGSYAADGLDDAWQVQYFGLDNPLAAPAADPDGDGQANAFEFTAGLVPTDPASRFLVTIAPVAGQPAQKAIVFSPRLAGRTYTVTFKTDLNAAPWTPLPAAPFTDAGSQRTVTDPAATDGQKFYRVQITKP